MYKVRALYSDDVFLFEDSFIALRDNYTCPRVLIRYLLELRIREGVNAWKRIARTNIQWN